MRWDAWTTAGELAFYRTGLGGTTGGRDASRTLTEPANAARAITVGRLHHAPDVALRRPTHAHTNPSGRHHPHRDQHGHPDRHGHAIVCAKSPCPSDTAANAWRRRALQLAGADARRETKTRSHRAGRADHRGTGDPGSDTKPGALRQLPIR